MSPENIGLLPFVLTAFVTLFVVVDPPGLVPVFVSLTAGREDAYRRYAMRRALSVGFAVALFFLVAGRWLLTYLGVSMPAFSISGGILLFCIAFQMLFGHRAGLQSSEEELTSDEAGDIAIFPLAIPLISGPGTLTTLLTLAASAHNSPIRESVVAIALAVVFAITGLFLRFGTSLMQRLGHGGVQVLTRVFGLLLAALAIQFVLGGISGFSHSWR